MKIPSIQFVYDHFNVNEIFRYNEWNLMKPVCARLTFKLQFIFVHGCYCCRHRCCCCCCCCVVVVNIIAMVKMVWHVISMYKRWCYVFKQHPSPECYKNQTTSNPLQRPHINVSFRRAIFDMHKSNLMCIWVCVCVLGARAIFGIFLSVSKALTSNSVCISFDQPG